MKINLILGYDDFYMGYVGSEYKIEELILSKQINENEKILCNLESERISILLRDNFFRHIAQEIKGIYYPCHIIKINGKTEYLYRQYINYDKLKILNKISLIKFEFELLNINTILRQRNKLDKHFRLISHDIAEVIMSHKYFIDNVGQTVPFSTIENIKKFYFYLQKYDYIECKSIYKMIISINTNLSDNWLLNHILNLDSVLINSKKKNINFTIEII